MYVPLYQARNVNDHLFVFRTSVLPLIKTFLLDFRTVSTVWYFCSLLLTRLQSMLWLKTPTLYRDEIPSVCCFWLTCKYSCYLQRSNFFFWLIIETCCSASSTTGTTGSPIIWRHYITILKQVQNLTCWSFSWKKKHWMFNVYYCNNSNIQTVCYYSSGIFYVLFGTRNAL